MSLAAVCPVFVGSEHGGAWVSMLLSLQVNLVVVIFIFFLIIKHWVCTKYVQKDFAASFRDKTIKLETINIWLVSLPICYSDIMAGPRISRSTSSASSLTSDDYSLYSNLSEEELLQLAIERSLTDTHGNTTESNTISANNTISASTPSCVQPSHCPDKLNPAINTNQPSYRAQNSFQAQTTAHYSSPNPPPQKPPDPWVASIFILSLFWPSMWIVEYI